MTSIPNTGISQGVLVSFNKSYKLRFYKRRRQQIIRIVSDAKDASSFYYNRSFLPGIHFYTLLAEDCKPSPASSSVRDGISSSGLRMPIPDTVVYGETGRAIFVFTDDYGIIRKRELVNDEDALQSLHRQDQGNKLTNIIIYKEQVLESRSVMRQTDSYDAVTFRGHQIRVPPSSDVEGLVRSAPNMNTSFAMQRYVKCKGPAASIVRSVFERGHAPHGWLISNVAPFPHEEEFAAIGRSSNICEAHGDDKEKVITEVGTSQEKVSQRVEATRCRRKSIQALPSGSKQSKPKASMYSMTDFVARLGTNLHECKACTITKLTERGCAAVSALTQQIVQYIERKIRLRLDSLVADYIKDEDSQWWLLQIKGFRIKGGVSGCPPPLPLALRRVYFSYRGSQISDADEQDGKLRQQRPQTARNKLYREQQCKCCLALYPRQDLTYKMTTNMIYETLSRIRARLLPNVHTIYLDAITTRACAELRYSYESCSVCCNCYAIYERDQQLCRMEAKFALATGHPSEEKVKSDLYRVQQGVPEAETHCVVNNEVAMPPSQMTLCRMILILHGLYDIPTSLIDLIRNTASPLSNGPNDAKHDWKLYLRLVVLGSVECIPLDSKPSGMSSSNDDEVEDTQKPSGSHAADDFPSCYPLRIIRTYSLLAPGTPLRSKLRDTSGLKALVAQTDVISIQLVRSIEPPLRDPVAMSTAIHPSYRGFPRKSSMKCRSLDPQLLGSTHLQLSSFRSASITKIDFYACMGMKGEGLNLKGSVGLKRVRFMDTQTLAAHHHLRAYGSVFVPDATFIMGDPFPKEWMECLADGDSSTDRFHDHERLTYAQKHSSSAFSSRQNHHPTQ